MTLDTPPYLGRPCDSYSRYAQRHTNLSCYSNSEMRLNQILVNNSERAAGFISGLNELAFYIYFCTKVERRFLGDETYEEKFELENRIIDLYSTILQFMLKARQYFETSPASKWQSMIS